MSRFPCSQLSSVVALTSLSALAMGCLQPDVPDVTIEPVCYVEINGMQEYICGGDTGETGGGATPTHTELYGTWESGCDNGVKTIYSAYSNAIVEWQVVYTFASCTGTKLMYIERNGPHAIGATVSGNIKQADVDFQYFYVYLYDTALKNTFNTNSVCGITNWTTGSDIDVSGRDCAFSAHTLTADRGFPATNEPLYTIFEIVGSSLYLGDPATGDGSTSANRPASLDNGKAHIKNNSYLIIPSWAH